jgi:Zn ribbon nucleic-acid-binding protein
MDEKTNAPDEFDELAGLMKASFPNIRCLRCGHDKFYLFPEAKDAAGPVQQDAHMWLAEGPLTDKDHPVTTLACVRCGHIEQHLTGLLRRAQKPIVVE